MAELHTLARPYAKAAFEAAVDSKTLSEWADFLGFAAAASNDESMAEVLAHPGLSSEQKASTFIKVCGDKANGSAQNFLKTLATNKRLELMPQIAEIFEELKAELEKAVDVEIVSAFDMTDDQKQKLTQALTAKLNREIRIGEVTVDTSLVGGVIVRAGDLVVDGSVRGKLGKLAEAMNS